MAITVDFGVVAKRHNSTLTGTHSVEVPVLLKEDCSVLYPSLLVSLDASVIFTAAGTLNHCYIPLFDRYYYINNWTWERGAWRADCNIDVLASWKNTIGGSSQYVLRSASESDGSVYDAMYATSADVTETDWVLSSGLWSVENGIYMVGVVSGPGSGLGAVGYYAFTASQFRDFCTYLFGTSYVNMQDILQDITAETWKSLYNPFQYIVSCQYLPYTLPGAYLEAVSTVPVGYWTIPAAASRLVMLGPYNHDFTIPWTGAHPQAGRGRYVYCAPYTEVTLTVQPFGHISLPSDIFYDRGSLRCAISVDNITGVGILRIGGANTLAVLEARVGVPIQIAQMSRDFLGMATTAIQSVAGVVGSALIGDVTGAVSGAAGAIDSAVRSQVPRLATTGGNGSMASLYQPTTAHWIYHHLVNEDVARLGRPLCAVRTINTLSGYILTEGAAVQTAGTDEENKMIASFMDGGFYYE